MEEVPHNKRLLFIHAGVHEAAPRQRTGGKRLDTEVRRHVMLEIGKARRKPPKAPQYDTHVWSLPKISETPTATDRTGSWATQDKDLPHHPENDSLAPEGSSQSALTIAAPPSLYALSVFEREWGEDSFSAYGFNLIMVAGYNEIASCKHPRLPTRCS